MIHIERLPEPTILTEKRAAWKDAFLKKRASSPGSRPHSSRYAHKEIVDTLTAMSSYRCFYCQQSLKDCTPEVDHYIEVNEAPDRAFDWSNLYLSCKGCNAKLPSIPPSQCVDPCDPDVDPADHLKFDNEQILPRKDSERGRRTIMKYKLNRPELDLKRSKALRECVELINKVLIKCVRDGRLVSDQERELIESFAESSRPFSAMFRVYVGAQDIPQSDPK